MPRSRHSPGAQHGQLGRVGEGVYDRFDGDADQVVNSFVRPFAPQPSLGDT
jgi:hypothetical protein